MARDTRLWVESYRPKSIKDYVWVNDAQKSQVEGWIAEKNIPNLLLSGGPGIGKCLGANETITIRVDRSMLTADQLSYLDNLRTD